MHSYAAFFRTAAVICSELKCAVFSNLKLMLFCRANWTPLTISGSSGTMANTVTPMKYCRTTGGIPAQQHTMRIKKNLKIWNKQSLNTWEMEEWVRMGSMFSVQRSAQHVISTVATISTARALQRDQCTTWWPAGDKWHLSSGAISAILWGCRSWSFCAYWPCTWPPWPSLIWIS